MCEVCDGVWWSGALQLSRFPHSRAEPWPPTRHTGDTQMELFSCNHFIYSLPSFYQDLYFFLIMFWLTQKRNGKYLHVNM